MTNSKKVALTGIKPTGIPHLGNFFGAIAPALEATQKQDEQGIYFVANLHALTSTIEPALLKKHTYEVAATWLALGLNPEETIFFRQSDILELTAIYWILCCETQQGLLDRAHAYKAAKDKGQMINAGVYTYPVLMAADILAFHASVVPIGEDQKQHVEYARDIAQRFNHTYGSVLTIPEPRISQEVAVVVGTDGRKMSKSYQNTIPIFASDATLKKAVFSIQTDSTPLESPKDPNANSIYKLYQLLTQKEQAQTLHQKISTGHFGWGDAKKELLAATIAKFKEQRLLFESLMNNTEEIEKIFAFGALRAQKIARQTLQALQSARGIA